MLEMLILLQAWFVFHMQSETTLRSRARSALAAISEKAVSVETNAGVRTPGKKRHPAMSATPKSATTKPSSSKSVSFADQIPVPKSAVRTPGKQRSAKTTAGRDPVPDGIQIPIGARTAVLFLSEDSFDATHVEKLVTTYSLKIPELKRNFWAFLPRLNDLILMNVCDVIMQKYLFNYCK